MWRSAIQASPGPSHLYNKLGGSLVAYPQVPGGAPEMNAARA